MPGRKFRIPEDMLPFAQELSSEEKKKWIAEWRRLLWHSPRFVAVFVVVAAACITFFALFMPAWEFTTEVWSRWVFGLAELGIAYRLADFAAYGFSKTQIEKRIAASLGKQKCLTSRYSQPRRAGVAELGRWAKEMMLLQRIKRALEGGYRFPDGARLIPDGRDGKIYVAPDGRRVAFQCELWDKSSGAERCIYESTIRAWMRPHQDEPFGDKDRQEIIKKTCEFFEKTKTTYVVH